MIYFFYDKTFEGLLSAVFYAYSNQCFPHTLLDIDTFSPLSASTTIQATAHNHAPNHPYNIHPAADPSPTLFTNIPPPHHTPEHPPRPCSKLPQAEYTTDLSGNQLIKITTSTEEATRVWNGLKKKLSPSAIESITTVWLSELANIDHLIFRYICKAFDYKCATKNTPSIELNFADPDVLQMAKIFKKVNNEQLRVIQFLRFQKAKDGTYFAPIEPLYNVLSLTIAHFTNRFRDQEWIIYDLKRQYGYYYNKISVKEITFTEETVPGAATCANSPAGSNIRPGSLPNHLQDTDEQLYTELWKTYFQAICIKERINPKLHKQNLPVRFWKHLTEKQ